MVEERTPSPAAQPASLARLEQQLREAGLDNITRTLVDALRPLAPLAAHALWFVQPGFALFGRASEIGALADWLHNPAPPEPTAQQASQAEPSESR